MTSWIGEGDGVVLAKVMQIVTLGIHYSKKKKKKKIPTLEQSTKERDLENPK